MKYKTFFEFAQANLSDAPDEAWDAASEEWWTTVTRPKVLKQGIPEEAAYKEWKEMTKRPSKAPFPRLDVVATSAGAALGQPLAQLTERIGGISPEVTRTYKEDIIKEAQKQGVWTPGYEFLGQILGEAVLWHPIARGASLMAKSLVASRTGEVAKVAGELAKKYSGKKFSMEAVHDLVSTGKSLGLDPHKIEIAAGQALSENSLRPLISTVSKEEAILQLSNPVRIALEAAMSGPAQGMLDALRAEEGNRIIDGLWGVVWGTGATAVIEGGVSLTKFLRQKYGMTPSEASAVKNVVQGTATKEEAKLFNELSAELKDLQPSLIKLYTDGIALAKQLGVPKRAPELRGGGRIKIEFRDANGHVRIVGGDKGFLPSQMDMVVNRLAPHLEHGGEILSIQGDQRALHSMNLQFEKIAKKAGETLQIPNVLHGEEGRLILNELSEIRAKKEKARIEQEEALERKKKEQAGEEKLKVEQLESEQVQKAKELETSPTTPVSINLPNTSPVGKAEVLSTSTPPSTSPVDLQVAHFDASKYPELIAKAIMVAKGRRLIGTAAIQRKLEVSKEQAYDILSTLQQQGFLSSPKGKHRAFKVIQKAFPVDTPAVKSFSEDTLDTNRAIELLAQAKTKVQPLEELFTKEELQAVGSFIKPDVSMPEVSRTTMITTSGLSRVGKMPYSRAEQLLEELKRRELLIQDPEAPGTYFLPTEVENGYGFVLKSLTSKMGEWGPLKTGNFGVKTLQKRFDLEYPVAHALMKKLRDDGWVVGSFERGEFKMIREPSLEDVFKTYTISEHRELASKLEQAGLGPKVEKMLLEGQSTEDIVNTIKKDVEISYQNSAEKSAMEQVMSYKAVHGIPEPGLAAWHTWRAARSKELMELELQKLPSPSTIDNTVYIDPATTIDPPDNYVPMTSSLNAPDKLTESVVMEYLESTGTIVPKEERAKYTAMLRHLYSESEKVRQKVDTWYVTTKGESLEDISEGSTPIIPGVIKATDEELMKYVKDVYGDIGESDGLSVNELNEYFNDVKEEYLKGGDYAEQVNEWIRQLRGIKLEESPSTGHLVPSTFISSTQRTMIGSPVESEVARAEDLTKFKLEVRKRRKIREKMLRGDDFLEVLPNGFVRNNKTGKTYLTKRQALIDSGLLTVKGEQRFSLEGPKKEVVDSPLHIRAEQLAQKMVDRRVFLKSSGGLVGRTAVEPVVNKAAQLGHSLDAVGQDKKKVIEVLQKILNEDPNFEDTVKVQDYYNGLAVIQGTNPNGVFGATPGFYDVYSSKWIEGADLVWHAPKVFKEQGVPEEMKRLFTRKFKDFFNDSFLPPRVWTAKQTSEFLLKLPIPKDLKDVLTEVNSKISKVETTVKETLEKMGIGNVKGRFSGIKDVVNHYMENVRINDLEDSVDSAIYEAVKSGRPDLLVNNYIAEDFGVRNVEDILKDIKVSEANGMLRVQYPNGKVTYRTIDPPPRVERIRSYSIETARKHNNKEALKGIAGEIKDDLNSLGTLAKEQYNTLSTDEQAVLREYYPEFVEKVKKIQDNVDAKGTVEDLPEEVFQSKALTVRNPWEMGPEGPGQFTREIQGGKLYSGKELKEKPVEAGFRWSLGGSRNRETGKFVIKEDVEKVVLEAVEEDNWDKLKALLGHYFEPRDRDAVVQTLRMKHSLPKEKVRLLYRLFPQEKQYTLEEIKSLRERILFDESVSAEKRYLKERQLQEKGMGPEVPVEAVRDRQIEAKTKTRRTFSETERKFRYRLPFTPCPNCNKYQVFVEYANSGVKQCYECNYRWNLGFAKDGSYTPTPKITETFGKAVKKFGDDIYDFANKSDEQRINHVPIPLDNKIMDLPAAAFFGSGKLTKALVVYKNLLDAYNGVMDAPKTIIDLLDIFNDVLSIKLEATSAKSKADIPQEVYLKAGGRASAVFRGKLLKELTQEDVQKFREQMMIWATQKENLLSKTTKFFQPGSSGRKTKLDRPIAHIYQEDPFIQPILTSDKSSYVDYSNLAPKGATPTALFDPIEGVIYDTKTLTRANIWHENMHAYLEETGLSPLVKTWIKDPMLNTLFNAFEDSIKVAYSKNSQWIPEEVFNYLSQAVRTNDKFLLKTFVDADKDEQTVLNWLASKTTELLDVLQHQPDSIHKRILERKLNDIVRRSSGSLTELQNAVAAVGDELRIENGKYVIESFSTKTRTEFSTREALNNFVQTNYKEPLATPELVNVNTIPSSVRFAIGGTRTAKKRVRPSTSDPIPPEVLFDPPEKIDVGFSGLTKMFVPFMKWLDGVSKKNNWPALYEVFDNVLRSAEKAKKFEVEWLQKAVDAGVHKHSPDRLEAIGIYLDTPSERKARIAKELRLTEEELKHADWYRNAFDQLYDELGINKPYLRDYIMRMKSSDDPLAVMPDSKLAKAEVDFIADHFRSGALDVYETNILKIYSAYVAMGSRHLHMADSLKKAQSLVNMRNEQGKFLLGSLQPQLKRTLEMLKGRPDNSLKLLESAAHTVISSINAAIERVNKLLPEKLEIAKLDEDGKSAMSKWITFTYAGTMGARVIVPIRDFSQVFTTAYPLLGNYLWDGLKITFGDALSTGLSPSKYKATQAYSIAEKYNVLMKDIDYSQLFAGGGGTHTDISNSKLMWLAKKLIEPVRWSNNSTRLVTFWGQVKKAEDAIELHWNGDSEAFRRKSGLMYLDEGLQKIYMSELKDLLPDQQQDFIYRLSKDLMEVSQWNYSKGALPGMYNYSMGRLLGQYGSWPTNYAAYLDRIIKTSWREKDIGTGIRFLVAHTALITGLQSVGIDGNSWVFTQPLAYAGGPILTTAMNIPEALDFGSWRGDEARSELFTHVGPIPIPRILTMSVPGGLQAVNVIKALNKDEDAQDFWMLMAGFTPMRKETMHKGLHAPITELLGEEE